MRPLFFALLGSLALVSTLVAQVTEAAPGEYAPSGTTGDLIFIAKTFGLGVSVMAAWIWILLQERKTDRAELKAARELHVTVQDKHTGELKEFLRENIATMNALTKVVEAVAPSIASASANTKANFDASVNALKEHITSQCNVLKEAMNK